jgi:pimeloyl-ACP methyl ester carboxylesterase
VRRFSGRTPVASALVVAALLRASAAVASGIDSVAAIVGGPPEHFDAVDYGFATRERDIVVEGLRLRMVEGGPEDGPRVLLLHCFGLSLQVWRDVLPLLARAGFRVVAYDAPGHGKSARPARPLRLAELGRIATGVLDVLGWDDAFLVGNSMGGGTALYVALDAPARVRRLVLVDAVGLDLRMWFGRPWRMLSVGHMHGAPDWAWGLGYDLAVERRSPLVERVRAELLSTRADPEASAAVLSMKTIVDDIVVVDRTPDLPRLRVPTLVVTGAHDRLVDPEHARRLQAGIAGASLVVYDDLGHLPELEDGARLAADVIAFLRPDPAREVAPPPARHSGGPLR